MCNDYHDYRRKMKRIIVLPFKDADVTDGLRRLLQLNSNVTVVLPVVPSFSKFTETSHQVLTDSKAKYHLFFTDGDEGIDNLILNANDITMCSNPTKEILREVTSEDVLAMVWDECIEAHLTLHAVEDLAVETWNIEDGLDVIEVDFDDEDDTDILYEEMQEALSNFIESFATYITAGVLDVITKTIEAKIKEDEGKKDINPFNKE